MKTIEILSPCPFCGMYPSHFTHTADGENGAILCENCGARGPSVRIPSFKKTIGTEAGLPAWQSAAIKDWNTRSDL